MLSETSIKELHKLADQRVEAAIGSVIQLMENEDQVLGLISSITMTMVASLAMYMHENIKKPDGSQPSKGECWGQVLLVLAKAGGGEGKVLSEEEAKQAGLI